MKIDESGRVLKFVIMPQGKHFTPGEYYRIQNQLAEWDAKVAKI